MQFNEKVQAALRHVNYLFPEVIQVFFGADGRWLYCGEDFEALNFDGKVDVGLLEDAADAAGDDNGFPCAYRLLHLADYYLLWDELGNIPVSNASYEVEVDTIEGPFLHFPVGTYREEIWHWFEAQHPLFVVGEVMSGQRRKDDKAAA
jgi:hypothetical protein